MIHPQLADRFTMSANDKHQLGVIQFATVLRCLSLAVSASMVLCLLLWTPASIVLTAQTPVPERLATLEAQMALMHEVRAMALSNESKINTIAGVGTGAFATLAILDILQLLGAKRRGPYKDGG